MVSENDILARLKQISYPGSSRDIVALGLVGGVRINGDTVIVHLRAASAKEEIIRHIRGRMAEVLSGLPGIQQVHIHMPQSQAAPGSSETSPVKAQTTIPGVRRVIAVASGKGGVGKSTVAVNLALGLGALGQQIGLLDADIYGPSIPLMMGTEAKPRAGQDKKIYPVERYGIRLISMGFFLDAQSPVIWRGPIVMSIIRQFLRDVVWGELDYLVVDLPPGTGDIALTLMQEVPLDGGVIVSTPQDVALLDVQRSIAMFRQVNVPILGAIENMSFYVCPACGEQEEIFGHGGVRKTGVKLLGEVPLMEDIRTAGDNGKPIIVANPDHQVARVFGDIARQVVEASEAALQSQPGRADDFPHS